MNRPKKVTPISSKPIGVPKTVVEKLDYLKLKNKNIDKLIDVFGLELDL